MPSSAIHQAVAKKVNETYHMNEELLYLGSIAPDCWRHSTYQLNRKATHFVNMGEEDYKSFFKEYKKELDNPFVMGYLIHLMTDFYWFNLPIKSEQEKISVYSTLVDYYQLPKITLPNGFINPIKELDINGIEESIAYINETYYEPTDEILDISEVIDNVSDLANNIIKEIEELKKE